MIIARINQDEVIQYDKGLINWKIACRPEQKQGAATPNGLEGFKC